MARKASENRTVWIAARVRPDELAIIEQRAARANRTVSELIRDSALSNIGESKGPSAFVRHRLSRIALVLKGRDDPVFVELQGLIQAIDDELP